MSRTRESEHKRVQKIVNDNVFAKAMIQRIRQASIDFQYNQEQDQSSVKRKSLQQFGLQRQQSKQYKIPKKQKSSNYLKKLLTLRSRNGKQQSISYMSENSFQISNRNEQMSPYSRKSQVFTRTQRFSKLFSLNTFSQATENYKKNKNEKELMGDFDYIQKECKKLGIVYPNSEYIPEFQEMIKLMNEALKIQIKSTIKQRVSLK